MEYDRNDSAVVKDGEDINKHIKSIPTPANSQNSANSSADITSLLLNSAVKGIVDMTRFTSFTQSAQQRDTMYRLIDSMAEDPIIAAVLETYAEDATERNDDGRIVWAESDASEVAKYVTYLLDTLEIDKHVYKWVHSLCKYGDVYLQLFKRSEYDIDTIFKDTQTLTEKTVFNAYAKDDKLAHYVEMVANPAEMFELTRLGKTSGFIKADVANSVAKNDNTLLNLTYQYKFKASDIGVYPCDKFSHALLEDNVGRVPEEVTLLPSEKKQKELTYRVRRGQSLLQNVFKIWRELSLLENSMLLNRVTKSAVVRMINVEVGDMDKSMVGPHLQGVKALFEQKAALDIGNSMQEYTNPGPIENNIYVPTYNGKGAITTDQIGGDVNITQLPDVEYYQNKYFGALRAPKQYFGLTNDAAGFSGGQSLAIISSRYAKMVKRIQTSMCQAITDIVNLFLIDKGLNSYINKFNIKMLPPTTQEEIERRDNVSAKIGIANDVMSLLSDIEDQSTKMKITKSLLSSIITDPDVIALLDEEISNIESNQNEMNADEDKDKGIDDFDNDSPIGGGSFGSDSSSSLDLDNALDLDSTEEPITDIESEELPSPADLGKDFADNGEDFE